MSKIFFGDDFKDKHTNIQDITQPLNVLKKTTINFGSKFPYAIQKQGTDLDEVQRLFNGLKVENPSTLNETPESKDLEASKDRDKIQKIYNETGGDLEEVASMYTSGVKTNQLINPEQVELKDKYFRAIAGVASKVDLAKTVERQSSDIGSAVIKEANRLKSGDELFKDISEDIIFRPEIAETAIRESTKTPETLSINLNDLNNDATVSGLLELSKSDIPFHYAGDFSFFPNYQAEVELSELKNNYNFTQAPESTGFLRDMQAKGMEILINEQNKHNYEFGFERLAIASIYQLSDFGIGLKEQAENVANAFFEGDSDAILTEVGHVANFFALAAPEALGNLFESTGLSPVPGRNIFTKEGAEVVAEANKTLQAGPLTPIFAITALKGSYNTLKASSAYSGGKLSAGNKKFIESYNKLKIPIDRYVELVKTANKLAKEEINASDVGPLVKRIASEIKDPNALSVILNAIDKNKTITSEMSAGVSLDPKTGVKIPLSTSKEILNKQKGLELPIRVALDIAETKLDIALPGRVSELLYQTKQGKNVLQYETAVKDVKSLIINIANTKKLLEHADLTKVEIQRYTDSMRNASALLGENLKIIGTNNQLTYFNAGFPMLTKKQLAEFLLTAKNIAKGTKIEKVFDNKVVDKIVQISKEPFDYTPSKIKTPQQKRLMDQAVSNSSPNKQHREIVKSNIIETIAKNFIDVGWDVNRKLEKIQKSTGGESLLATKVRISKEQLRNTSSKASMMIELYGSKLFEGFTKNQEATFNEYVNVRRVNALYRRKKKQVLETYPKAIELAENPKLKKYYKGKLKEAETYISNLENGVLNTYVVDGAPELFLKSFDKKLSQTLKQKADVYFEFQRELVDLRQRAGLITKETAENWKEFDYTKTEYILENKGKKEYDFNTKKITTSNNGVTTMKSGDVGFVETNYFEFLQDNVNNTVNHMNRNKANLSLKELLESKDLTIKYKGGEYPTKGIEGIGFIPKGDKYNKKLYQKIEYFDNGVKKSLIIDNKFAEGWITSDPLMALNDLNVISNFLLVKPLKYTATGNSPTGAITFLALDMASVAMTQHKLYSPILPKRLAQMTKDYVDVLPDVRRGIKSPLVQEAIDAGLTFYTLSKQSRSSKKIRFAEYLKEKSGYKFRTELDLWSAINGELNDYTELWTRMALYKRGIKNKLTPEESAYNASAGYINYSAGGRSSKGLESVFPYSSASIQATRNYANSLRKYPASSTAISLQTAAIAGLAYSFWNTNLVSKENRSLYERVSPYDKFNNWIVPIPVKVTDSEGLKRDLYLKIRKDSGQKAISSLVEMVAEKTFFDSESGIDLDEMEKIVGEFTPYQLAKLPPTLTALFGVSFNQSMLGSKIYKGAENIEDKYKSNKLGEEQIFKDIGDLTNSSPAKLKFAFERAFTSGNFWVQAGYTTYDATRNLLSSDDKDDLDRQLNDHLGIPNGSQGLNSIKKLGSRYIGVASTRNYKTSRDVRNKEKVVNTNRARNNQYVDSYILRVRSENSFNKKRTLNNQFAGLLGEIKKVQGEQEAKRVWSRYEKQISVKNSVLARGVLDMSYGRSPYWKASVVLSEITLYMESPKAQKAMLEELLKVKGYFSEPTKKHYNQMITDYYQEFYKDSKEKPYLLKLKK